MSLMLGTRKALLYGTERGRVPEWAVGMDMWSDFTKKDDIGINDNHPQPIFAPNASGLFVPFEANALVRTDLGLQNIQTRGNFLPTSDFGTWQLSNGATRVTNDNAAPDGNFLASTLGDPVTTGDTFVGRNLTVPNDSNIYAVSAFFKKTVGALTSYPALAHAFLGGTTVVFDIVVVNTTTGAVSPVGNPMRVYSESWGDFWRVVIITANNGSGNTQSNPRIYPAWNGVGAGSRDAAVTGSCVAAWPVVEVGNFAGSPIVTSGTALTVTGNRQTIGGVASQLTSGVAGLIQFDLRQPIENARRIIWLSDGTATNRAGVGFDADGQIRTYSIVNGTVISGGATAGPLGTGPLITVAFALSGAYRLARAVGGSVNSANTQAGWPTNLNTIAIASEGYTASNSTYQFTRKLALNFLAPQEDPAVAFNDAFAKAQLAAAA